MLRERFLNVMLLLLLLIAVVFSIISLGLGRVGYHWDPWGRRLVSMTMRGIEER